MPTPTLPPAAPVPANPRVIDGHNDTLLALYEPERGKGRSFFERSNHGHLDLPRAQEAGLAAAMFAIFTPSRRRRKQPQPFAPAPGADTDTTSPPPPQLPPALTHHYALRATLDMAALLLRLEAESNGALSIVRSSADLRRVLANPQTVGAVLHIEGAECIDRDFAVLDVLVAAGLRSLGIVWSRPTLFAEGVPFAFPSSPNTGPGLTDLGRELVRRCNAHRILIDLSHLNEKGFWDVAALSDAPLVATHSCAHALSAFSRNLTDAQIKAIADSGGMVGINFFPAFLRADGDHTKTTSLSEIVRHIAYVANLVGVDHVGFGSDMDGAEMPDDFVDVTGMGKLLDALRAAGFDAPALEKIACANWSRVLQKTWGE